MTIETRLAAFITEELLDHKQLVDPDDRLLTDGLVDSLGMMRLVAFIDEHLGLQVPPEDVVLENFSTITQIANYLRAKGDWPTGIE